MNKKLKKFSIKELEDEIDARRREADLVYERLPEFEKLFNKYKNIYKNQPAIYRDVDITFEFQIKWDGKDECYVIDENNENNYEAYRTIFDEEFRDVLDGIEAERFRLDVQIILGEISEFSAKNKIDESNLIDYMVRRCKRNE